MRGVLVGIYRHYKGGIYDVLGTATHTETQRRLVVYQDENRKIWARPEKMFKQKIKVEGRYIKRFTKIG